MYNLNYNITNCRLNRPVGRPFVPTARFDEFSGSLVLAIPGTLFKNGYVNVFNQINAYDDISAYIVSGALLNESTGQYYQQAATQSLLLTGSVGFYSASVDVNKFESFGYETSLFFTGSRALKINPYNGSGSGVNLSSDKSFAIESWVAFPMTASFSASVDTVFFARPNRVLAQKYLEGSELNSSYLYEVGWTGDVDPNAEMTIVSGSSVFYMDELNEAFLPERVGTEEAFYPVSSSTWTPYQWKHYAVSYSIPSGSENAYLRQYINGTLIAEQVKGVNAMNFTGNTPTLIFGDDGNADPSGSAGGGAFFQDFRMYNGTNKNYTGSQFTPPESMIIGIKEPYPQYNP